MDPRNRLRNHKTFQIKLRLNQVYFCDLSSLIQYQIQMEQKKKMINHTCHNEKKWIDKRHYQENETATLKGKKIIGNHYKRQLLKSRISK